MAGKLTPPFVLIAFRKALILCGHGKILGEAADRDTIGGLTLLTLPRRPIPE